MAKGQPDWIGSHQRAFQFWLFVVNCES
ncbi:hypothetical protein DFAR_3280020 [Desulfarculales bacterium]